MFKRLDCGCVMRKTGPDTICPAHWPWKVIDLNAVAEFMVKHHLAIGLDQPDDALVRKRIRLMIEELAETVAAMDRGDRVAIADGLGDLLYVVIGTALVYGIDLARVFDEIHRSNMSKAPLTSEQKGGKGPGYSPPDLRFVLRDEAA